MKQFVLWLKALSLLWGVDRPFWVMLTFITYAPSPRFL